MRHRRPLAWLLLAAWAACAFKVWSLRAETQRLMARDIPRSLGMGDSLKAMVDTLESELLRRSAFDPPAARDPLALKRVVRLPLRGFGDSSEFREGSMRLSATILSPGNHTAIVKYRGRSHSLHVGDTLDQRVVRSIDKRTVVLDHRGRPEILMNQPAPRAEIQAEGGKGRRLEELEL